MTAPDTILINGKFATLDPANPAPEAVAITDKYFSAVGDASEILNSAGPSTKVINLSGRRAIPGLCDNHIHVITFCADTSTGKNYQLFILHPSVAD